MILRLVCAKIAIARLAMTAAFTLGAVAGAAAVVGACAARQAIADRRPRAAETPAT